MTASMRGRHVGRVAQIGVDDADDWRAGGVEPFDDGRAEPELARPDA